MSDFQINVLMFLRELDTITTRTTVELIGSVVTYILSQNVAHLSILTSRD